MIFKPARNLEVPVWRWYIFSFYRPVPHCATSLLHSCFSLCTRSGPYSLLNVERYQFSPSACREGNSHSYVMHHKCTSVFCSPLSSSFHILARKIVKNEAWSVVTGILSTVTSTLRNSMRQFVSKSRDWTIFRKRKWCRTETLHDALLLSDSETQNILRRPNLLRILRIFLLCFYNTSVFRPKASKPLNRRSRTGSLASQIAIFDTVRLYSLIMSERLSVSRANRITGKTEA